MTSKLAEEDIEALLAEGCVVHPADVIRLNALGLKLEKKPDFRLATLPRIALCGDVRFVQPNIEQSIFLEETVPLFASDAGTKLALEAYVFAHPEKDWLKKKVFPRLFALKCARWVRKHLGKETVVKIRAALDYVKYGMNPFDGEYPVYVEDENFDRWYDATGDKSTAMKKWADACACGIDSYAALKSTSDRLTAMIERAWYLKDKNISEDEKKLTAEYFATLKEIQERARAERDAKMKENDNNTDEVIDNG